MLQTSKNHAEELYDERLLTLPVAHDCRGSLCFVENGFEGLPFKIERIFWIYNVPATQRRGFHAHRTCWELVVAVSGKVAITLIDKAGEKTFVLDSPNKGLLIPPMNWCKLERFSPDCVCLCAASQTYSDEGYINDWNQFCEELCLIEK